MESKVAVTPKFLLIGILFFVVCLMGVRVESHVESHADTSVSVLSHSNAAKGHRLQLMGVENDTEVCEFQTFYGSQAASSFIFPQTKFAFRPEQALMLSTGDLLIIKCCKGSYLPVFVQYGGVASGETIVGYDGPFYLSMWLGVPQVPELKKIHVRYMVKSGEAGSVGVKIGKDGDYRFVAYDNLHFIL